MRKIPLHRLKVKFSPKLLSRLFELYHPALYMASSVLRHQDFFLSISLFLTCKLWIRMTENGREQGMDEGTFKTPIPKCRLSGHFCWG
jgi:hypothetical protein